MMKFIKTMMSLAFCAALVGLSACDKSEEDEPQNGDKTYVPYSSNIGNATSLVLYDAVGNRAGEDKFGRPGLYKIDETGNISAVAITFTTDKDGNRLENDEQLFVRPLDVYAVGKDFTFLKSCYYYDEAGKEVFIDSNHHLIVSKKTGKIYCIDKAIFLMNGAEANFSLPVEADDHTLLIFGMGVARITFENDKAVYNEICNHGKGWVYPYPSGRGVFNLMITGNIYSNDPFGPANVLIASGGYDIFDMHKYMLLDAGYYYFTVDKSNTTRLYFAANGSKSVEIASLESVFEWNESWTLEGYGYAEGTNLVIARLGDLSKEYCIVFDKSTQTLAADMSLNMPISPHKVFNNCVWNMKGDANTGYEMEYIDLADATYGSFTITLNRMDIQTVEEDYWNGFIILNGILRADGSKCVATVNLTTQESKIEITAPSTANLEFLPLN